MNKSFNEWSELAIEVMGNQIKYRMYRSVIEYSYDEETNLPEDILEAIFDDVNQKKNRLPDVATFYYEHNYYWVEINGKVYVLDQPKREDFNVLPTQEELDKIKSGTRLYCFLGDGDYRHPDSLKF